jgi:hypothetical protein
MYNKFRQGVIGCIRKPTLKELRRSLEAGTREKIVDKLRNTDPVDVIVVSSDEDKIDLKLQREQEEAEENACIESLVEEVYGGLLVAEISVEEIPTKKPKRKKRTTKKRVTKKTTEAS